MLFCNCLTLKMQGAKLQIDCGIKSRDFTPCVSNRINRSYGVIKFFLLPMSVEIILEEHNLPGRIGWHGASDARC